MFDLIFLVLYVYIIINALFGRVNDKICFVALLTGIIAGIAGLADYSVNPILNLIVLAIAFTLKKVAHYLADNYKSKRKKLEEEYREKLALRKAKEEILPEIDYDDPNVRFGGGSGENRKGT